MRVNTRPGKERFWDKLGERDWPYVHAVMIWAGGTIAVLLCVYLANL